MDIIERGTLVEKCEYCFAMYDVMEQSYLDLFSLRAVMKKAYTYHILNLEEAMRMIKAACIKQDDIRGPFNEVALFAQRNQTDNTLLDDIRVYDGYINWEMFVKNSQSINLLKQSLTLALDRMEIQKAVISQLEVQWDFGLDQLEQLFELHKPSLDRKQSINRIQVADALGKHSPELVSKG